MTKQKSLKSKVEPFPSGSARRAGKWDNGGRFYPDKEFAVPGSFKCREPSRAFPSSYLKHFYTRKYAALLLEHKPDLYLELHGYKNLSDAPEDIQIWVTSKRINPKLTFANLEKK
jgi:hypothetical protein